jgi:hypothetical protein
MLFNEAIVVDPSVQLHALLTHSSSQRSAEKNTTSQSLFPQALTVHHDARTLSRRLEIKDCAPQVAAMSTDQKPWVRTQPISKDKLRAMLAEAVRNTQPELNRVPEPPTPEPKAKQRRPAKRAKAKPPAKRLIEDRKTRT